MGPVGGKEANLNKCGRKAKGGKRVSKCRSTGGTQTKREHAIYRKGYSGGTAVVAGGCSLEHPVLMQMIAFCVYRCRSQVKLQRL